MLNNEFCFQRGASCLLIFLLFKDNFKIAIKTVPFSCGMITKTTKIIRSYKQIM